MSCMVGAGRLFDFPGLFLAGASGGDCRGVRGDLGDPLEGEAKISLRDMRRFFVADSPALTPGAARFVGVAAGDTDASVAISLLR